MIDGKILVIAMLIVAFLLFGHYSCEQISKLEAQLKTANAKLESVQSERKLSDNAVNQATTLREQIHAQAREQLKNTEQVLQENSSWADAIVPSDIRERLFKQTK